VGTAFVVFEASDGDTGGHWFFAEHVGETLKPIILHILCAVDRVLVKQKFFIAFDCLGFILRHLLVPSHHFFLVEFIEVSN